MIRFSTIHLILLAVTVLFWALSMLLVSKLPRRAQTAMFILGALVCAGGIFFRYGFALHLGTDIHWKTLCLQMMQVCNFNMILVVAMLLPKFEQARQYSIFFSMFATGAVLVLLPSSWAGLHWSSAEVLNSWANHTFAVALPLWMLAARRLKPQKKYVIPTMICVAVYFSGVYICSELFIGMGLMTPENSYSFIYNTHGISVLEILWRIIPQPFFYLLPLAPLLFGFFVLLAKVFARYEVLSFSGIPVETEEEPEAQPAYRQEYKPEGSVAYEEKYAGEAESELAAVSAQVPVSVPVSAPTQAVSTPVPPVSVPVRPVSEPVQPDDEPAAVFVDTFAPPAPVRPASGVILRPNYASHPETEDEEESMVEQAGMAE